MKRISTGSRSAHWPFSIYCVDHSLRQQEAPFGEDVREYLEQGVEFLGAIVDPIAQDHRDRHRPAEGFELCQPDLIDMNQQGFGLSASRK